MRVICVDDEKPALDNFRLTVKNCPEIQSLQLFQEGKEALRWMEKNPVDAAFLDMEMRDMNGIELAEKMKKINKNIRIIFITAHDRYALQAFGVDAIGYVMKPYTKQEIQKELRKAANFRPLSEKRVKIQTIPDFTIWVDGKLFSIGRKKAEELFALLVDRGNAGITTAEAIDCMWPDRVNDENTQSLYRMTFKRLMDVLKEKGIDNLIESAGRKKFLRTELVDCDLYSFMSGDKDTINRYCGEYMREYSWAEIKNAQMNDIKNSK